jgi:hypothetical protein
VGAGQGIGRCQATLHADTRSTLEEVAAGRSLLAYNVLGAYGEAFARGKPQLGVIYPNDYTLVASRVASRRAPNVRGARAWLDHMLSRHRAPRSTHDALLKRWRREFTPSPVAVLPLQRFAIARRHCCTESR